MPAQKGGRHYERLNEVPKGPGTFAYNGSGVAVEYHPTPKLTGPREPIFDADGNPVIGKDGKQAFERPGKIKLGQDGKPVLGGPPKEVRVKLDTFVVQGIKFPEGKPIRVEKPELARKLRCLDTLFDEIEEKAKPEKSDKK